VLATLDIESGRLSSLHNSGFSQSLPSEEHFTIPVRLVINKCSFFENNPKFHEYTFPNSISSFSLSFPEVSLRLAKETDLTTQLCEESCFSELSEFRSSMDFTAAKDADARGRIPALETQRSRSENSLSTLRFSGNSKTLGRSFCSDSANCTEMSNPVCVKAINGVERTAKRSFDFESANWLRRGQLPLSPRQIRLLDLSPALKPSPQSPVLLFHSRFISELPEIFKDFGVPSCPVNSETVR
jgi:hypothetical protein